jgi:hypothetical protein
MPLVYKPVVTGKVIDTAIKAQCSTISGQAATQIGPKMWTAALQELYKDFDTVLSLSLQTYLSMTSVIFPPAIPTTIKAILPMLNMTSMASASASSLDAAIKSQTASMTGSGAMAAGVIVQQELCSQIGKDLLKVLPDAIVNACADKIAVVPPGFTSPPMVASLAPGKPIYKGLIPATLKGLLTPYLGIAIKTLGTKVDADVKAQTSQLSGSAASVAGELTWNAVLTNLTTAINTELSTKLPLFMAQSIGAWMTPLGPGTPLIPPAMAPTPGATSLPAICILV